MPASIDKTDPRYPKAKNIVESCLILQSKMFAGQNFGASLDALFVNFVVLIAHAEGRPMSASKIASYLNMPRTTVLRRLQELCHLNLITREGTKYYVSDAQQNPSPTAAQLERMLSRRSACD